ncbi:MAG: hypothetical protein HY554_00860, partial [Elusimicrobia bacterium]|nr:hypothetical protein [Elusimicrobiota bacterium]
LVLAAIVMASIDSPLASLTASFVTDIYKPLVRADAPERHYLVLARASVAVFGLLLAGIAYVFSSFDKMLWLAFKIGGLTFGSLLGVFLLGLLTQRRANRANLAAMVAMVLVNFVLLLTNEGASLLGVPLSAFLPRIAWSWMVVIGTAGTFGLGWVLGPILDPGLPGEPSPGKL